jgi:hypothetical protein
MPAHRCGLGQNLNSPCEEALFPFYVISLGVVIIAAAFPELMLSVPKYLMPQFMQ